MGLLPGEWQELSPHWCWSRVAAAKPASTQGMRMRQVTVARWGTKVHCKSVGVGVCHFGQYGANNMEQP